MSLSPQEEAHIEDVFASMRSSPSHRDSQIMINMEDVSKGRRLSRVSIEFFQRETKQHSTSGDFLIGQDGKVNDDYILKRASINKRTVLKSIPMLADLTSEIRRIDGWVLTQLLLSGYAKMSTKIDELNKINVFPIADGDTGANMKVCLKLPTRNLLLDPNESVLVVASNMAADVLLNGQGNSGTILSHFFVSLAEEIKAAGKEELTPTELAKCLVATGAKMIDAVPNPVEGTLLSVSRDACLKLGEENDGQYKTLKDLLGAFKRHAQEELQKTPDQLVVDGVKVLEQAGVVDSGAQGFVYCVEGMWLASQGQLPEAQDINLFKTAKVAADEDVALNVDHTVTDSHYQFCTECVILLKDGLTKKNVMELVDKHTNCSCPIGDSVACVGAPAKEGGDMVKVHIHTNHPQEFFEQLQPFSQDPIFKKEKVEDMYVMREQMHGGNEVDLSEARFTIMGMCDLFLPPLMKSDDMHTLPVFIVPANTQEPIDLRFTSDAEAILALNHQRHKSTALKYSTASSNPMQMKIEFLAALAKGKPVLVFIFSKDKRVSVFGQNVMKAIELLEPDQQKMVKVLCHGWGFYEAAFLMEALKHAQEGNTIDEAYDACKDYADRTFNFVEFSSSETVHKLLAWRPGLFSEGFQVRDGSYTAFGLPAEVREGDAIIPEGLRALRLKNVLGSGETLEDSLILEAHRIKDSLKPGQKLGQILVSCVGRPDHGHRFVQKLKDAGVEIGGQPIVYNAGFMSIALSSWGELTCMYRVIE
jgi:hypothetical protein